MTRAVHVHIHVDVNVHVDVHLNVNVVVNVDVEVDVIGFFSFGCGYAAPCISVSSVSPWLSFFVCLLGRAS